MLNREKSKRRMPEKKIVKGNQNLNLRKNWIDALRGLAMLFVLYGHLVHGWNEYFVFTSAIKIPLFFSITGYVFKIRDGRTWEFIRNLMIKIGIPWGILTLIPVKIGYCLVRMDIQGALKTGYKFVSGASYWYMPCCIAAEIIFFIILKYSRKVSFVSVTIISVSACGFIMAKAGIDPLLSSEWHVLHKYSCYLAICFGIMRRRAKAARSD